MVAVGDELLSGATVDLNSPWLAQALEELGVLNLRTIIVGDDEDVVAAGLAEALALADFVIVTGGLGPTEDDQTRHAAARAVGCELAHSEEAWAGVRTWWDRRGVEIPAANRRQALMPAGAEVLANARGTAPGFTLTAEKGARLFSLPGPPFEMRAMFEAEVRPRIQATDPGAGGLALHRFQLFGLSESLFAYEVGSWMSRDANPLLGCSVKNGILTASLRARGVDDAEAARLLAERSEAFRERFRKHIFNEGDRPIEHALGELLIERNIGVTLAESCTAGLAAGLLASTPGISAVLRESFVTYADASKVELLGVSPSSLAQQGAVSEGVAIEMARGAAARAGARAAVAISGIAGPGGGTEDKPVGTVCFATLLDGEAQAHTRHLPPTSRDHVRTVAAHAALVLLWRRVAGGS